MNLLKNRLIGRFLAKNIISNNKMIVSRNSLITESNVYNILMNCDGDIWIRSPLTCQARVGIYKLCYGMELGCGRTPQHVDSIGVLATQSIGEHGTQLTLRTFHGLTNVEKKHHEGEIKGCLISPFPGIIRIKTISCVWSDAGNMIVTNTKCTLSISNGKMKFDVPNYQEECIY